MRDIGRSRSIVSGVLLLLCIGIFLTGCGSGSGGDKVTPPAGQIESIDVTSALLEKKMRVKIYLPHDYSQERTYPVLYMIHGYTSNEDMWMPGDLQINLHADRLIDSGRIRPLIIVAPEMDNSWGINSATKPRTIGNPPAFGSFNLGRYEDYLITELIPYIDSHYSTVATRDGRFIGGISMGGFTALHNAFIHTDLFSKVGGHSPGLFPEGAPLDSAATMFANFLYPNDTLRHERDPIYIAQHQDLTMLQVYLDSGSEDSCHYTCKILFDILHPKGVTSEFHVGPGGHDGFYWSNHLDEYLLFYVGK